MIDQNGLIEIINNAAPIVATSPVLVKLTECITDVFKTLYSPRLTFRKGKAEVDVDMYRKKKEMELFDNQSFTLYEITRLKNFVNSAKFASLELERDDDSAFSNEDIDFDWIMRFFDAVGNISNEELQQLWGKVLAGEIRSPGKCSLRTLDIIRNMSANEAGIFNKLCSLVVHSGDCSFIFSNGFQEYDGINRYSKACIQKEGFVYSSDIIPMIECGLVSVENALSTDFKTEKTLAFYNKSIICLAIDETQTNDFTIEPYYLTSSGVELYHIISAGATFQENRDYMLSCCKEFKEYYPDLVFSARNIHQDSDQLFDEFLV